MHQVEVKTSAATNFQQSIKAGEHSIASDAPKAVGGEDKAPNPHELLLAALGACTSITMQMYAKRKGWDLKEVTVKVKEEPAGEGQPTSRITRDIRVSGNLAADQVEALKAIAEKCPIHKMLSGANQISTMIAAA
jgi:putative redox protein